MDNQKHLEKYRKRVVRESIIKSVLFGLLIGFLMVIFLSLFFYLRHRKNIVLTLIVSLITFVIATYLVFKTQYKPTIDKVAQRVDNLGLEERIITMVDFQDKEDDFIIAKQREDAITHLEKVDEKNIKYKIPKSSLIILLVCAVLAISCLFLPGSNSNINANLNSNSNSNSESLNESQISESISNEVQDIIDEMLDDLKDIIDKAEIDNTLKEELNEKVDKLEEELNKESTIQDKIDQIEKTKEEIQEIIDAALTKIELGKALQEFDYTKELGIAIENSDLEKVDTAFVELKGILNQSQDINAFLNELSSNLLQALENAVDEQNDALIEAVSNFATQLAAIKDSTSQGLISEVESIMDVANEAIKEALKQQDEMEDANQQMQDTMQNATDSLQQIIDNQPSEDEPDNPSTSETPSSGNEPTSNNSGQGDSTDSNPPIVFDNDSLGGDAVIDGSTPYLDVYDQYYEEIMLYLAGEEIPDDIREIIERYLEIIG